MTYRYNYVSMRLEVPCSRVHPPRYLCDYISMRIPNHTSRFRKLHPHPTHASNHRVLFLCISMRNLHHMSRFSKPHPPPTHQASVTYRYNYISMRLEVHCSRVHPPRYLCDYISMRILHHMGRFRKLHSPTPPTHQTSLTYVYAYQCGFLII